jgi:hypothetical protein
MKKATFVRQHPRMGGNDAWHSAIAENLDAIVVGHDHANHRRAARAR